MTFDYKIIRKLDNDLKELLENTYKIDHLDIEDVFTNTQLSKIEQRPHYLYLVLEFPEFDKNLRRFTTKEIHCFLSEQYFLIIDKHEYKHFKQFDEIKDSHIDQSTTSFGLFYEMYDYILTKIFRVLGKFRSEVGKIEELLFDDIEDDLLQEILIVRKNLTNFSSIVYPLERFTIELQTKYTNFIDSKGIEKLDDSLDKVKKMLNNLKNFRDQIILLHEINETLIARSTNKSIKALTSLNIIIFVPSLITGFFGMNAYFGWLPENSNYIPLIMISLIITTSTLATYAYFKVKKLL